MKNLSLMILVAAGIAACAPDDRPAQPAVSGSTELPTIAATVQSPSLASGAPVNVAFWQGGSGETFILAAAGSAGLQVIAPDGQVAGRAGATEAGLVAVVPDFELAAAVVPLVFIYDPATAMTVAYTLDAAALTLDPVMTKPVTVPDELTGLCHYRSRLSGSDYLYAVTDHGLIYHYQLYTDGNDVRAQLLRRIPAGKGSGYCAVDPRDGMLYLGQESTGIWRVGAEPESDTTLEPIDLRAPFGTLGEEVKGVAIYPVDVQTSYLLAADPDEQRLTVYDLPDGRRVASVRMADVREAEGIAAIPSAPGLPSGGMLAVADESDEEPGPGVRLITWQTLADGAGLSLASGLPDYPRPAVVRPLRETDTVRTYGDAADDPAIWVNPDDPSASLIIGTNKKLGLNLYDLEGRTLQTAADGRMNNVDLRDGFPLGGDRVTLVTASNRTNDSIAAYRLDGAARRLVDVAAGVLPTGFADPYGLCMYHSAASDEFYVFINESDRGVFRQWRLYDDGRGRVAAEQVREFEVGSQAEGCVADDATGSLYIGEEDVGLWQYSAEPDGADARSRIDSVGNGELTADVEGLAIWAGPGDAGYIVVSNQGADDYVLYRRSGDHAFVGVFHVVANAAAGVDGSSETDGLDVVSTPLGAAYPDGLLVVQDGRNIAPEAPQNFKLISWANVVEALGFERSGDD